MSNLSALPVGTELSGAYRIERVLGAGGFGITYLAEAIALARMVTIKEYFPTDFAMRDAQLSAIPAGEEARADFEWGLSRFIDEAKTLARFDHANIVRVHHYFEANGTAYMVLQFEQGHSLKGWAKNLGRAPRQHELDTIVKPLLDALEEIHRDDFLHRDIAPDNIIIRPDGSPVLIDFGSARGDIAKHNRTMSVLVKPGYSPYEQYSEVGERQGPWTDIYALAATLYHVVTGKRPPDAPTRWMRDDLLPAAEAALAAYRQGFLAAITSALALEPGRRPQSISAWRGALLAPDPPRASWLKRVATVRSLGRSAGQTTTKTKPLTHQPGVAPPPPDLPIAEQGGLLDYIDGLKDKPAAADSAAVAATAPSSREAEASLRSAAKPAVAASAPPARVTNKPARGELVPLAPMPKPPRPKRTPVGPPVQWRSFVFKFLIGAVIASAAVLFRDQMPDIARRLVGTPQSPATVTSSNIVTSALRERPRLRMLAGHPGGTNAVRYSQDGRSLVTAGRDGTLKVWSPATGALRMTHRLGRGPATSLDVSGARALTGHSDGHIDLLDIASGAPLGRYKRNEARIWAVRFLGRGRFAASSHDWTAAIWDLRQVTAPIAVLDAHGSAVQTVAFAPGAGLMATGSADKTVKLWRAADASLIRTYRGHRDFVTAVALSVGGNFIAAGALDGRIRIWTTNSRRLRRVRRLHNGQVTALAFSPDGRDLASTGSDGRVRLWSFRRSRSARSLLSISAPALALAFSPDGSQLAVASASGPVRLWPMRRR